MPKDKNISWSFTCEQCDRTLTVNEGDPFPDGRVVHRMTLAEQVARMKRWTVREGANGKVYCPRHTPMPQHDTSHSPAPQVRTSNF